MQLQDDLLRVDERAVTVASPEVGQDDHARDRRVGAPQRGEGVALDLHYNLQNCQISHAEDDPKVGILIGAPVGLCPPIFE
jgi:hypothetical protein